VGATAAGLGFAIGEVIVGGVNLWLLMGQAVVARQ